MLFNAELRATQILVPIRSSEVKNYAESSSLSALIPPAGKFRLNDHQNVTFIHPYSTDRCIYTGLPPEFHPYSTSRHIYIRIFPLLTLTHLYSTGRHIYTESPPGILPIFRVFHRYRNTRGDQVTGTMGTGTVWYLAHCDIPCTCTAVLWVCHRYITTW